VYEALRDQELAVEDARQPPLTADFDVHAGEPEKWDEYLDERRMRVNCVSHVV
jgi:hypothetical protein